MLESESNKATVFDKYNRVDLKVRNENNEIIIIEVQYEREFDYLQRTLYGTSRVITKHIDESDPYFEVVKVISVNILCFDLGYGADYIYRGTTRYQGIHQKDELELNESQKNLYGKCNIYELFPKYYLIRINNFDDIAKNTLDEWVYFLKNEEVPDEFSARGLKKAREQLDIIKLPEEERIAYEQYVDDLHYRASMVESSYGIGYLNGRKEGRKEGISKDKAEALLVILNGKFGMLPHGIVQKVGRADDKQLEQWLNNVFLVDSLEQLLGSCYLVPKLSDFHFAPSYRLCDISL